METQVERRQNQEPNEIKDRFWLWMGIVLLITMFTSVALVQCDERDHRIERAALHKDFLDRCEKHYPVYRCKILWDSYQEEAE